jgi:bacterioferritin-associated ferredoxin
MQHSAKCDGDIDVDDKVDVRNMMTTMTAVCSKCDMKTPFRSEPNDTCVGKAFSWASVSAGIMFGQAEKLSSLMSVKFMCYKTFKRNLAGRTELWAAKLEEVCKANAKAEAEEAIKFGSDGKDNVPEVSAAADGVYGMVNKKRFASPSCAVSLFGTKLKRILDLRVANGHCGVCSRAKKLKKAPPAHTCYKTNIAKGSESELILKCFQESEKRLGLRYRQLVADNDATTYKKLRQFCPYEVTKADCIEHFLRILRAVLMQMTKGGKKHNMTPECCTTIRGNLGKILFAARLAAKRSAKALAESRDRTQDKLERESDRTLIIGDLARDLRDAGLHALGYHGTCRPEVCTRPEDVPAGLETEFYEACESVTETSVVQVLQEFCDTRPALDRKKQIIVQQGKRIFEKKSSLKKKQCCRPRIWRPPKLPKRFLPQATNW